MSFHRRSPARSQARLVHSLSKPQDPKPRSIWLWVKRYPKQNPVKKDPWKKQAVPWSFRILTHLCKEEDSDLPLAAFFYPSRFKGSIPQLLTIIHTCLVPVHSASSAAGEFFERNQGHCLKGRDRSLADLMGLPVQNVRRACRAWCLTRGESLRVKPLCGGATPREVRLMPRTSWMSKLK